MKMSNWWNKLVYRLWAPIYDATINRVFVAGRTQAIRMLSPEAGERILLVGVGTGADAALLPAGARAVGLDLSQDMLSVARRKIPDCRASICLVQADAQVMPFCAEAIDALVLNLILSVVPDGRLCLESALRVLRPGGRVVIFDKFLPESNGLVPLYQFFNIFTSLLGTDITAAFRR
jgi:ubiquinone/menaquinone biosynthesis C-methylase UbiE